MDNTSSLFPALKRFSLYEMEGLVEWMVPTADANAAAAPPMFPCLEELYIHGCPQLKSIPSMTHLSSKLKKFVVDGCDSLSHISANANAAAPPMFHLVSLKLNGCMKCEQLPTLGRLSRLEILEISRMKSVSCIGDEFYNSNGCGMDNKSSLFAALKRLSLCEMEGLVKWMVPTANVNAAAAPPMFPCLEEFFISRCPQLKSIPSMTHLSSKLKKFEVHGCDSLSYLSANANAAAPPIFLCLEYLRISRCPQLKSIPSMTHLSSKLKKFEVGRCDSLSHLSGEFQASTPLQYFKIFKCRKLVSIPSGLQHCTALEELYISECNELASVIANCGVAREWQSLREVYISLCPKLTRFPIRGLLSCASLKHLEISDCEGLISISDDDDGECDKQRIHCPADGSSSSLVELSIDLCPRLRYFPEDDCFHRLTRLKEMTIGRFSGEAFPAAKKFVNSILQHSSGSLEQLWICE